MIQTALRVTSAFISLYMLLIFFRIILTWFPGHSGSRLVSILARATDPYLLYFRRWGILRSARVDFSPVLALILLSVLNNVVTSLMYVNRITLGYVLSFALQAVGSAGSFILFFFLALVVIRLIGWAFNVNTATNFWVTLDRILQPVAYRLITRLTGGKQTGYLQAMLLLAGVAAASLMLWSFGIRSISLVLQRLPF
jgi:YggT family protein